MPVVQATIPSSPRSIAPVYSVGDSMASPAFLCWLHEPAAGVAEVARPVEPPRPQRATGPREILGLRRRRRRLEARLHGIEAGEDGALALQPARLGHVAGSLEALDPFERRAQRRRVLALAFLLADLEPLQASEQLLVGLRTARLGLGLAEFHVVEALGERGEVRAGRQRRRCRGASRNRRTLGARAQRRDLAGDRLDAPGEL